MIKFLRRNIIAYKEYILLVILSIISLTILASNEKPQVKKIRTFALGTFAVFTDMLNSVTAVFQSGPSKDQLLRENAKLTLEVNKLRKQGIENNDLRGMLAFRDTTKYPLVAADVVSKLVNKVEGNYIIDLGTDDGIKAGMPVMTYKGLVGIISDTAKDYSVVKTLYNANLSIAVTIQRINVDGILSWDGNELIIKNIPTTYDVKIGDIIETSDFSTLFPPSVPIGVVSKKEKLTLGLLHTLSVKPYSDIYSIHDVFVIKTIPSKQIDNLEMNLMK